MNGFIQTLSALYSVCITEQTVHGMTVSVCTCESEGLPPITPQGLCAATVLNRVRLKLRGIFTSI